jgi:hypothetical protein
VIGLMALSRTGSIVAICLLNGVPIDIPHDDPLTGTTDWKQVQVVCDVPPNTAAIFLRLQLTGNGKLWMDDARLEIVGNDVPATDDGNLHFFATHGPAYAAAYDPSMIHDGHPAFHIQCTAAPPGAWCSYGTVDRHPAALIGHRLRLSVWLKSSVLTRSPALHIWKVQGGPNETYVNIQEKPPRNMKINAGYSDWREYEAFANVPADTQFLAYSFNINGNCDVWVDHYQITDLGPAPKQ